MSGTSRSFAEHLHRLARELTKKVKLRRGDVVVDIGCGDGTLLEGYHGLALRMVGVEPSMELCKFARKKGAKAYNEFFTTRTANKITDTEGHAKIVTATNVFAHVSDVHETLRGVYKLMTEDGIFVSESQYLVDLVQDTKYDMIYHEHLRYYSVTSLSHLLEQHDLEIFAVERVSTHGGSIRVYSRKKGGDRDEENDSVERLLAMEKRMRIGTRETFISFRRRVVTHKLQLISRLSAIAIHSKIAGIGAPDKANTLLTYCGLGPEIIKYLTELNPLKIGRYTPNTHVPIVNEEQLLQEDPPYALLLSWNFADEIISNLRKKGFKGKIIIPFPQIKVVG
jgi:SAM-dependent methyltransferase